MNTSDNDLKKIRQQIDGIDQQIQQCLHKRAELALQVAKIKYSAEKNPNFYCPEREAEILQQIQARNTGLFPNQAMVDIFKDIIQHCLALEIKIKVAFLGPLGTYSHAATLQYFGAAIPSIPVASIQEIFHAIIAEDAYCGVVPIENSSTGIIKTSEDMLAEFPVTVCGEVSIPIQHCLLGNTNTSTTIKKIYAHEQAFLQCAKWLEKNYPQAEKITMASNTTAIELLLNDTTAAMIASVQAAEIYNLTTLAKNIADNTDNKTRFLIIRKI